MTKTTERPIYRILFTHLEEVKEIYSQYISEETLVGFIEADNLLTYDSSSALFLDPNEVKRCYIPLHTIVRIDEISLEVSKKQGNVSHLPHAFKKPSEKK